MDARALFGYVMLYRAQIYLGAVVDYDALAFIAEHRLEHFVNQPGFDFDLAQELEPQLNSRCIPAYVNAVPFDQWLELTKAADLRAMMNSKYLGRPQ